MYKARKAGHVFTVVEELPEYPREVSLEEAYRDASLLAGRSGKRVLVLEVMDVITPPARMGV